MKIIKKDGNFWHCVNVALEIIILVIAIGCIQIVSERLKEHNIQQEQMRQVKDTMDI